MLPLAIPPVPLETSGVEVCMGMGKMGSHGSHGIPMGIGIRSAMGWEWELSAWEWELRRGVGIVFCE